MHTNSYWSFLRCSMIRMVSARAFFWGKLKYIANKFIFLLSFFFYFLGWHLALLLPSNCNWLRAPAVPALCALPRCEQREKFLSYKKAALGVGLIIDTAKYRHPDSWDTITESLAPNFDILTKILWRYKQICQLVSPASVVLDFSQWCLWHECGCKNGN